MSPRRPLQSVEYAAELKSLILFRAHRNQIDPKNSLTPANIAKVPDKPQGQLNTWASQPQRQEKIVLGQMTASTPSAQNNILPEVNGDKTHTNHR